MVTASIGFTLLSTGGLANRYPKEIQKYLSAPMERGGFRCGKIFTLLNPSKEICSLVYDDNHEAGILILGDSHADVLKEILGKVGQLENTNVYLTKKNCDLGRFGSYDFCSNAVLDKVLTESEEVNVKKVIAISLWEADKFSVDSMKNDLTKLVNATVSVKIMRSVPFAENYSPRSRAIVSLNEKSALNTRGVDLAEYRGSTITVNSMLDTSAQHFEESEVVVFSAEGTLRPEVVCIYEKDWYPLYIDNNHLSYTGANLLIPMFSDIFPNK